MTSDPTGHGMDIMFTYADVRACPSCRTTLPERPAPGFRCPACDVPLADPLAGDVFGALQRVDSLLIDLRAVAKRTRAELVRAEQERLERKQAAAQQTPAAPAGPSAPGPRPPAPLPPLPAPLATPGPAPFPAPGPVGPVPGAVPLPARTRGVRTTSVPVILLSLGALCLLVAALIFLAVAWSSLGVGGRTAVLIGFTAASGGLGLWGSRRGLRIAGEALGTVCLGLVALDVAGAASAGWFGNLSGHGTGTAVGLTVAVIAVGMLAVERDLVAPQIIGVGGLFMAGIYLSMQAERADVLILGASTALLVLLAVGTKKWGFEAAHITALGAAALTWSTLCLATLVALRDVEALTYADIFTSRGGAGLVLASLLLLTPLAISHHEGTLQSSVAASATGLTILGIIPAFNDGATRLACVSLTAGVVGVIATAVLPRRRAAMALVPSGVGLAPALTIGAGLLAQSLATYLNADSDLKLDADPFASPLLVVGCTLVVAALAMAALKPVGTSRLLWVRAVAGAVSFSAVVTLALYPVPLWLVVASLLVLAGAMASAGHLTPERNGALLLAAAAVVAFGAVAGAAQEVPFLIAAALANWAILVLLARRVGPGHVWSWLGLAGGFVVWQVVVVAALADLPGGLDTAADLFGTANGWAMIVAATALGAPLLVARHDVVLQPSLITMGLGLSLVLTWPLRDNGALVVLVTTLGLGAAWTIVAAVLPRHRVAIGAVPAALLLLPALAKSADLLDQARYSIALAHADLTLPGNPVGIPWTVVATALIVVALATATVRPDAAGRPLWARGAATFVALAGVVTLALYPVPLWTVVAALAAIAGLLGTDAVRRSGHPGLAQMGVAALLLVLDLGIASADSSLLVIPAAVLTALALASMLTGRFTEAERLGGMALPLVAALTWWSGGDAVGIDHAWLGLPAILTAAAVVLWRPRLEVELVSLFVATVFGATAVAAAADSSFSLSLHLTLVGALMVTHSIVHTSRRPLAWAGAGVLALASWVRMADLGVTAPEAYTLPTAVLLLVVGAWHVLQMPEASTRRLLPGSTLGTVPSLTWVVFVEPVSLRAALLGMACLALVILGASLRWAAPLVVGAVVGTVVVLAEIAPYAAQAPQWILLAFAGVVLTVVGVTWESRLRDVRRAASYVGRLR